MAIEFTYARRLEEIIQPAVDYLSHATGDLFVKQRISANSRHEGLAACRTRYTTWYNRLARRNRRQRARVLEPSTMDG